MSGFGGKRRKVNVTLQEGCTSRAAFALRTSKQGLCILNGFHALHAQLRCFKACTSYSVSRQVCSKSAGFPKPTQAEAQQGKNHIQLTSRQVCDEKWFCLTCVLVFKLSGHLGIFNER